MFLNNPDFKLETTIADKYRIYTPSNVQTGYHMMRYVEASNQEIYNRAGATPDMLNQVMDAIIERCNQPNFKNARTEIASLAQSIQYRTKYPVDQHCAVRMGCVLSFMEYEADGVTVSEDVNMVQPFWTDKKMKLAFEFPDAYSFFLSWGISSSASYRERLDTLTDLDYFNQRRQAISSLTGAFLK